MKTKKNIFLIVFACLSIFSQAQNCNENWKISQSNFEILPGGTVNFNYAGASNTGATFTVDFGDGSNISYLLGASLSFSHVYLNEGIYNITYTLSGTCQHIKSSLVTVSAGDCLDSDPIAAASRICMDSENTYAINLPSDPGWNLQEIIFNMGDGTFISTTSSSINYIYNTPGFYNRSIAAHYYNSSLNQHCYYQVSTISPVLSEFSTFVGNSEADFTITPLNPIPGSNIDFYFTGITEPAAPGMTLGYSLSMNNSLINSGTNPPNGSPFYTLTNAPAGLLCFMMRTNLVVGNQVVCTDTIQKCFAVSSAICDTCNSFKPTPGERYWLSAWVKVDEPFQVKSYNPLNLNNSINLPPASIQDPYIELDFFGSATTVQLFPTDEIIDGWQRVVGEFTIPTNTFDLLVILYAEDAHDTYFEDIRIHPFNASMKSYVYDGETFWLVSELDDNNYATFYEYDQEGGLIRIKKETSRGVVTIQETRSNTVKSNP